jgi:hypothetical protein
MNSGEALKTFFAILAVIVGIPMLVLMVRIGMFFGSLARSVTALELAATTFTTRVDKILEKLVDRVDDHEIRLTLAEQFVDAQKIDQGWAPDRRHPKRPPLSQEIKEGEKP